MLPKKELKVVFAPGCFDDFDGTQEELEALMADILAKAADGTLQEELVLVEDLPDDITDEEIEQWKHFHAANRTLN